MKYIQDEKTGFKHIKTIVRKIPNKRMPKRNCPSNVAGITETTMSYEYILIPKKENCRTLKEKSIDGY